MTNNTEQKPNEYSFWDPKTLQPHPVSAMLYLDGSDNDSIEGHTLTALEASNEIMEKMDVADLLENIRQVGICAPLVINKDGSIISGCRRWKVAVLLNLPTVPVEVRQFIDETEEQQAILDYNRSREKTFSQKMREGELHKEIIGKLAEKRILAGKRNPVPSLAQGSKHQGKTNTIVGSLSGIGKETFRKAEYIWQRAKSGDQKAVALIRKLNEKTTSVDAAYNSLRKSDDNPDKPDLSRWQKAEPNDAGDVWTCPQCGKTHRIFHLGNGKHRFMETACESE